MTAYTPTNREPFLDELAAMSEDQMLNHQASKVAEVLSALLPTDVALQEERDYQAYARQHQMLVTQGHWQLVAKEWVKAATTFTKTFPHHPYARTAWHAADNLKEWL